MVIIEENGNPFAEESLADQLQNAATPKAPPTPQQVEQAQKIEGAGTDTLPSTVDLLDDSKELASVISQDANYKVKRYNTRFLLAVLGIVVFAWLTFISYLLYQYLDLKSQPTLPAGKEERIQKTSDTYDQYGWMLWLFNLEQYANLSLADQAKNATTLLKDPQLNFVQKKDLLQVGVEALGNQIITLKTETKSLREQMNKDWFFPQELVEILKANNAVGSIQRSLLSLEVVKFSSAMKVFSLMDLFVSSLAENLGYSKADIREKLIELMKRGEKDVEYYLNVCYNNPYEPAKCDKIRDFDAYYARKKGEETFDTTFFKSLMELINNNLEYSNMPSFSITFNSFDGKSNSIAFSIEVNTLKEDEYALIQQGIRSPHIFIVSELIKLLKQSTFIVGKAIDAKDIKVTSKQVTIGGSKYVVNNSVKNFNLPIQKTTQREIFDFTDSYNSTLNNYPAQEQTAEHPEITEPLKVFTPQDSPVPLEDQSKMLTGALPNPEQESTWASAGFLPVTID